MRIGIFTESYKPYISGVVRSIELFTEELRNLGHQVYIFAPNYPGVSKEDDVYRFPSIPSLANNGFYLPIPYSPGLEQFINQHPLDIVHVHSPFILGRLGAKVARKLELPLVFTYHTLYDQYTHYVPFAKEFGKGLTRKVCVDFCNRCDLVITPTEIISRHIKNMGVESTVKWLPTGIKLDEFSNVDKTWLKQTYDIEPNETVLLSVGRLGKEKNIGFLIKCMDIINQQNSKQVKLVLVGDGPELNNLKKQVDDLGLSRNIIFTGKLPREEVIKAYCGADLFVFGSVTETQGIVIAEAKAAGLPVVAVNAFGVSNMLVDGEDGYLVSGAVDLFVAKVNAIIQNPQLRHQMSQRAIVNVQELSSPNCTLKLIDYYSELVDDFSKFNNKDFIKNN